MIKRTLTVMTAVALLAAGCSSSDDTADAVEAAEQTQSALVEAFLAGDIGAAVALYTDDVEFHDPMIGTETTGVASMRTQARTVFAWTDTDQTELLDSFVSDDGSSGVVVYRWVGDRGSASFDITMLQVHEYEDGLLKSLTNYYGNSDAAQQFGT